MKIEDLPRWLVGGTLVEYKQGCGREMEWGRGTVTDIGTTGDEFVILTDNDQAWMTVAIGEEIEYLGFVSHVEKIADVYYIDTLMGWSYAVAPKGVKIPKKPKYVEPVEN